MSQQTGAGESWAERQSTIAEIAARQLFFVGGAPRSGTTWLQQILDAHPDVSCRGEGLFLNHLTVPLENLMAQRGKVLDDKNKNLFGHTGGYPLPVPEDVEFLAGSAILLAMQRQCAGRTCQAIGEKTPENVFFFPRLRRLFPGAKFIAIARDPRDVLTSAWHFFQKTRPGQDEDVAKTEFVRLALPSMNQGTRAMLEFARVYPADTVLLTYEALRADGPAVVTRLFQLIGVSSSPDVVADCLARTEFSRVTGGRNPGEAQNGAFLRKGVSGDWPSTLTPAMNEIILGELGWSFSQFRWQA